MASILQDETGTGRGTWQQAKTGAPSYVKIVFEDPQDPNKPSEDEIANSCVVDIITSDASGDGAGGKVVTEKTIIVNENARRIVLPAGAYYINAEVQRNLQSHPVTVEVV